MSSAVTIGACSVRVSNKFTV